MELFFAAATNAAPGGTTETVSVGAASLEAFLWAGGFTIAWDLVDLWIRYRGFRFLKTQPFLLYLLAHLGISCLVTFILGKSVTTPWLVGLLSATANEMVLSNASITFGQANLLPVLDKFRELRGAIQAELDALKKAQGNQFHSTVSKLSVVILEREIIPLLVKSGLPAAEITKQLQQLKLDCAGNDVLHRAKLANDLLQLDAVYVQQNLGAWQQEAGQPSPPSSSTRASGDARYS